jgi:GT2 family glycosyltransferase
MTDKRLLVVIVNYRTALLTIDCLRSLESEVRALPLTRVVVTDNASGDDSVDRIEAAIRDHAWGEWASLMPLPDNGGFAAGNNAAIRPALESATPPDYVLLLNPDTVVREGAIVPLLRFMEDHPTAGFAGSRLEDPDGTPQCSAFRFPGLGSEFIGTLRLGVLDRLFPKCVVAPPVSAVTCRTDWVAGASMIIRREVFEDVGLMDEGYFMYYEEVDFCLAANRAGWACWYVPESRVIHLRGQASGVTDLKRAPKRRPQYWFDSRRRFMLKNHGPFRTAVADAGWMVGFSLCRVRRAFQGRENSDPPKFLSDFARNSIFLRGGRLKA